MSDQHQHLPELLRKYLSRGNLPAIASPLFIISNPKMVVAQCTAGIIGSMPALNARTTEQLDDWLTYITQSLTAYDAANPDRPAAPYAINLIAHKSNTRLQADLKICLKHKTPILITSLGALEEINTAAHSIGSIVFHDVINNRFAHKAIDKGADGLIAVAAGAGGHAGTQSPFSLIQEIRAWFNGPLALGGAIASGCSILAARAMGADFAYIGSAFIATEEANAAIEYKDAITQSCAEDIVYTNLFTGVHGNYLKYSITRVGLDPDNLPASDPSKMDFSGAINGAKAWKDIWGSGQGIGVITEVTTVADRVLNLKDEYRRALSNLKAS